MPTANDTRVRVDDLSKMTATVCGPASGFTRPAVLLEALGEVEDLGLLGRADVVVAEEVAGHAGPFGVDRVVRVSGGRRPRRRARG